MCSKQNLFSNKTCRTQAALPYIDCSANDSVFAAGHASVYCDFSNLTIVSGNLLHAFLAQLSCWWSVLAIHVTLSLLAQTFLGPAQGPRKAQTSESQTAPSQQEPLAVLDANADRRGPREGERCSGGPRSHRDVYPLGCRSSSTLAASPSMNLYDAPKLFQV